ncbi:phage integrase N-terminal SAM-like domain-containing protein [Tenacibaculum soleae]|uniref:phage integrase N-terminal SAM-like domain-containing protein n=1 Tax=Tenacibaculum soleae TaxID=447689 RepID=UPI0026E41FA4|nr:phage integrase N-terminal SAM-like domain-containing protein [Tenacibaculum soleae]MDO6813806.1 phage integrase N-terminal SAM-like domain-containing protein [Tenacibaculum soleae]
MKVVEIYIKKLTNKNYSNKTIETYVCYLEKFLHQLDKNPYHITTRDIENYLLSNKYTSISQQNQIIGSLKLYAKYIINKKTSI